MRGRQAQRRSRSSATRRGRGEQSSFRPLAVALSGPRFTSAPPLLLWLPRACLQRPRELLRARQRLGFSSRLRRGSRRPRERRARRRGEHRRGGHRREAAFAAAARRRPRVLRDNATDGARVVEVVVLVPILTDERLAREEEAVVPIGARVAEVGLIAAFSR